MDKQKQIEEMAKVILPVVKSFYVTCTDKACDRCIIKHWHGECAAETRSVKIANTYYNAGYRKIPENAVVLTREEFEKFAERVKMAFYYEFDELIPSIMADKIDEICKEITDKEVQNGN